MQPARQPPRVPSGGVSDYPFDRAAFRDFLRSIARVHGRRAALREGAWRSALAAANRWGWERDPDAPLPSRTVLVIGHQRSGTTWLHRMLAAHPAATAMPLHALLMPSDTFQRAFDRPRPGWLDRWQDRLLGPLDDLHRVRLHEPEEDEFACWALLRSPMNALDRPWPPGAAPRIDGDPVALAFYAQAVARQVRRTGRRYVGKNPHFTWRSDALRAALPGVRLVQLWRRPEQAIPSRLSLIREVWRRRGLSQHLATHEVERIYASSVRTYLGGLGAADLDLRYEDLVADPLGTVERVHAAFGLEPLDAATRAALGPHLRVGPSRHRYGLAEFGLDEARLRRDLAPVYEAFFP